MEKKIFRIISTIFIFSMYIFFSAATILGYNYQGSEESNIYLVYNVILFTIVWIFIVRYMFEKTIKFTIRDMIVFTIIILLVFSIAVSFISRSINNDGLQQIIYFILWGFTSFALGYTVSKKNILKAIIGNSRFISIFLNIASFLMLMTTLISGDRASLAGASYQFAGYQSALAFGLNYYYLRKDTEIRLTKFELWFRVVSFPILMISVLITGARGASVVLFAYLIYILISNNDKRSIVKKIALLLFGIIILLVTLYVLRDVPVLKDSIQRVFEYITIQGIDWSGTSGRDLVYEEALDLIKQSPFYGYGLFGYYRYMSYPHNLFLEVLLQGGLIYFSVFLILFGYVVKMLFINKNSSKYLKIIFLHAIIMLMFSATYMSNSIFWFVSSILIMNKNNEVDNKYGQLK